MEAPMTSIQWRSYQHRDQDNVGRRTSWLPVLVRRLLLWRDLMRERQHLRSLDDHALKDIGISRRDVDREASRPFWDTQGLGPR